MQVATRDGFYSKGWGSERGEASAEIAGCAADEDFDKGGRVARERQEVSHGWLKAAPGRPERAPRPH
jgi:hypothetical protein